MTNYELLYIVSNQYTENEVEKIILKINDLIEKAGAQIGYHKNLGKKKLAYPIKKVMHGYYILTQFELDDKAQINNINNAINLDKEIVRGLISIADKYEAKKSQQKKEQIKTTKPEKSKEEQKENKELNDKLEEILHDDNII